MGQRRQADPREAAVEEEPVRQEAGAPGQGDEPAGSEGDEAGREGVGRGPRGL